MKLFGGVISVTSVSFMMMCLFIVALLGYLLGRITIKGINLGTSGVFVTALLFGVFFYDKLKANMIVSDVDMTSTALKIIETLGLIMFVTAVGFIAGPNFFKDLKKNFKSYILIGVVIIVSGGLICAACYFIGKANEVNTKEFVAMLVGLLSGALTSTPAFSASKAAVLPEFEGAVTVGYGIAYLFGVVGVVLFVQLLPKLVHANMDEEVKKLVVNKEEKKEETKTNLITVDKFGIMPFACAVVIGIIVGAIKVPLTAQGLSGTSFSLTTTGGALLTALVFGHFGRIGKLSLKVEKKTLEVFRETGLMFFLMGAGIPGGAKFVMYFKPIYFLFGVLMTIVPMIVGYIFARKILKMSLLNTLGSITGGMTSTPALGTLINVAKTDDVASAYAATYPIALITVVLISQFIIILLG